MTPRHGRVLVVGASVAGLAAADAVRAHGHTGEVVVIDADPAPPYDKPPLSKAALAADWEHARGLLRPESHYDENGLRLELGRTVTSIEPGERTVVLDDGRAVAWDELVLAPGVRARRLPTSVVRPGLAGVHAIRSAADSAAVRAALHPGAHVVIVGGGFIGAEAAAVAAAAGARVTIVERLRAPFCDLFGLEVAQGLAGRHRAHGVELLAGVGVREIHGGDTVEEVELDDGRVLPADLVVLGIGAEPALGWLAGSGLEVDDGIVCDAHGRTSRNGVWAAGDAASWLDEPSGLHLRREHWTTAKEQGAAVGHNIARPDEIPRGVGGVAYFWSDQHGVRLQFLGTSTDHDEVALVHGSWDEEKVVVLFGRAGRLIGALGLGATRELMRFRADVAAGTCLRELTQATAVS